MARATLTATIGTDLGEGHYGGMVEAGAAPTIVLTTVNTNLASVSADLTAINGLTGFTALTGATAAMATAVADLATATTNVDALTPSITGDIVISINLATVTKKAQVIDALRKVLVQLNSGFGGLT